MYTVLLLKFGRHLCKGSLTVAVDEWFCLFCLFFVGGGGGEGVGVQGWRSALNDAARFRLTFGLSLLVLYSDSRGFSPSTLVFPSRQKPT